MQLRPLCCRIRVYHQFLALNTSLRRADTIPPHTTTQLRFCIYELVAI